MGTVVFPNAEVKIFLTADDTVRALRRYRELVAKTPHEKDSLSVELILQEMQKRDDNDTNRTISPLKQASDAVLIDTSHLSIDEVVAKIVQLVNKEPPASLEARFVYGLCRGIISFVVKLLFRLRVYGQEHVHSSAGIIIANHTSYLDPPLLAVAYPGEVHFLARETLFHVPILGKIIRALNTHPVANDAGDLHVLRQMVGLLNSGKKLILFPEGRRSPDGQLLPFARGFAFLAKRTKCTIFPAYIDGAFAAWPASRSFPVPFRKITCVFGSPLEWKEGETEEQFINRCCVSIEGLHTWLSRGAHGNPP
jgi:1-acyl-sn-glycerol-3-phosphate acyltransferase